MENTKIKNLIEKLKEKTINQEIRWVSVNDYLQTNDNERLRKHIIYNHKYLYKPHDKRKSKELNTYMSGCCEFNKGLIFLFVYNVINEDSNPDYYYAIALQPSLGQYIEELPNNSDHQEDLKDLHIRTDIFQITTDDFLNLILEG